jgi:SET domain-containing protein
MEPMVKNNTEVFLIVKETGRHGLGVFTVDSISQGTLLTKLTGKRISTDSLNNLIRWGLIRNDDPFQIGSTEFLVVDGISYFFNHSCDPNAGFKNESDLFALRDIPADEEIRFDYSATVSPSNPISDWIMQCNCGSVNCRKLIGHCLTLPLDCITAYIKAGAFQEYMLRELSQFGILLRSANPESQDFRQP